MNICTVKHMPCLNRAFDAVTDKPDVLELKVFDSDSEATVRVSVIQAESRS